MIRQIVRASRSLLLGLSVALLPPWASANPLATSLWDASTPLPEALFSRSEPCKQATNNFPRPGELASDRFLLYSVLGTNELLVGLCLESAGIGEQATPAFSKARELFVTGLEGLVTEARSRVRDAQQQRELIQGVAQGLSGLLRAAPHLGVAQSRQLQAARSLLELSTAVQLDLLDRNLRELASDQPKSLTRTMRIPVAPVAGFLKHLVRIELPDGGHCTGSFVGPRIVLTNFHCVESGMRVVRDYVVSREVFSVSTWWTYRGERATQTPQEKSTRSTGTYGEEDWALIEIVEDRMDSNDYLVVAESTPNLTNVMVAGYSGDVSDGAFLTLDVNCPVSPVRSRIQYECSTFRGASGAPLLSMHDQRVVVGLNNASRVGQLDSANTRGAKFAVRVERFAPKLYQLLGSPPAWLAAADDARARLTHAKAIYERRNQRPKLPSWND